MRLYTRILLAMVCMDSDSGNNFVRHYNKT